MSVRKKLKQTNFLLNNFYLPSIDSPKKESNKLGRKNNENLGNMLEYGLARHTK